MFPNTNFPTKCDSSVTWRNKNFKLFDVHFRESNMNLSGKIPTILSYFEVTENKLKC